MALSRIISEIFDLEKCRDLEIWFNVSICTFSVIIREDWHSTESLALVTATNTNKNNLEKNTKKTDKNKVN